MRNFTAQHIGRAFGLDLWTVVTIQMIRGLPAQPLRGGMVDGFADRCCDLNDSRAYCAAPQGRLLIFLGPLMVAGGGGNLDLGGRQIWGRTGRGCLGATGREGVKASERLLESFWNYGEVWEAWEAGVPGFAGAL